MTHDHGPAHGHRPHLHSHNASGQHSRGARGSSDRDHALDVHSDDHQAPSGGLRARLRHALVPHSHDAAVSLDPTLESSERGIRAVQISLVLLAVTAGLQLAVVYVSGSVALFADTIHNFSDALTAVPLWVAFAIGRRAATTRYTYGFGRAEDLAGLFVIAMIALSAVVAGWQAVDRLLHPAPIDNVPWVAAAALIGFLGNEAVALFRIREGKAIGSAALVADGYHARADGMTSLAVLLGAGGVAIGWHWADPAIGLLITLAILLVLRTAAREVFRRLMDAVDPNLVERAQTTLVRVPGVEGVRRVRMRWIGHEIHAEIDLDVTTGLGLAEAHEVAHRAEAELLKNGSKISAATVHAYPAQHDWPGIRLPAHS